MSVNWSTGAYRSPEELSRDMYDDGLALFLLYYQNLDELPEELRDIVNDFQKTYEICRNVFQDAGVIL